MIKTNHIAEIQVSYSATIPKKFRMKISTSKCSYNSFLNTWNINLIELQEEFKILLLNNSNEVLGIFNLAKGTIQGVNVDIRLLFSVVLKSNSTGIIIAHNHPSGNLSPSNPDIEITKQIKKISEILNIKLLDHLIISKKGYYSFADNGTL